MTKPPHGAGLTPFGIFTLAQSFEDAGHLVVENATRQFSDHPQRLLFLHAIETYLRAYLRLHGAEPDELRGYMHDVGRMLATAKTKGLLLEQKAADYVMASGEAGDYVRVRYDYDLRGLSREWPDTPTRPQPLSKLVAATDAVRAAVRDAMRGAGIEVYDGREAPLDPDRPDALLRFCATQEDGRGRGRGSKPVGGKRVRRRV
ncbi:hypothetical protein [Shinella sp.]|uniref:hypothetical protein n=1 Tax=Shinella sp. TaxID=1870904 RepID=UPI0025860733|nr:hypothetical protein [Shinella sp.]MCW5710548.1 hypothetical protein [Shinella sp.]